MLQAMIMVVVLAASSGSGAPKGRIKDSARYDESQDFSKHFDDEVKYQRRHPDDEDAPARRVHRRRSRRRRSDSGD